MKPLIYYSILTSESLNESARLKLSGDWQGLTGGNWQQATALMNRLALSVRLKVSGKLARIGGVDW